MLVGPSGDIIQFAKVLIMITGDYVQWKVHHETWRNDLLRLSGVNPN